MIRWEAIVVAGMSLTALILGIETSNRIHAFPADRVHFSRIDITNTGDASVHMPECKTVETDDGRCIAAGTYQGDPVLLFGRRPYLHVIVDIDMHGATIPMWFCDAGLCADDLPTTMATIVVHPPEAR